MAKVIEETHEIYESNFQDPEEYADVFQALIDMAANNGVGYCQIIKAMKKKAIELGDFSDGYINLGKNN